MKSRTAIENMSRKQKQFRFSCLSKLQSSAAFVFCTFYFAFSVLLPTEMKSRTASENMSRKKAVKRRFEISRGTKRQNLLAKRAKPNDAEVWSFVRSFDKPGSYKPFVKECKMLGKVQVGSIRKVMVNSGLPATSSFERLEILDDKQHIFSFRILGGDHRLQNYVSVVTLHPEIVDGQPGTLFLESYVVDVPEGNTKEETVFFVEALVKCNLNSLAAISQKTALSLSAS